MVDKQNSYGKNNKRIVFTETDHRHAQLISKLKIDGMTQASFFRSIITGYIDGDQRIESYVLDEGTNSTEKKLKVQHHRNSGHTMISELGLDEQQVEDLFDVIAEGFPEL